MPANGVTANYFTPRDQRYYQAYNEDTGEKK